jgi:isopenicillin-N epimerase
MLALALDDLGADWYVGNCHKWLFAPKACAFLYAAPAAATTLHPTVISNFHGAGFPQEFDWQGTRDYSAWLAVEAALDFVQAFGAARYRQHLHDQAQQAAALLCAHWQVRLPAAEQFAAMVSLPWPWPEEATADNAKRWHDRLWKEHRVEVPVLPINGQLWLRISAQIYNELSDYEALARALDAPRRRMRP